MVQGLLAELRGYGVHLRAEGGRLRCSAPAGGLTPELRDRLQRYKREILDFLQSGEALARQQRAIVPLEQRGTGTPVFAVAGHNGDVFCYRALVQHLGGDRPFFGLEPPGLDGQGNPLTSVRDIALYFADQVRAFRPAGPYVISGYCAGGSIALELGRELLRDGADVTVVLFGSPFPTWYRFPAQQRWRLGQLLARAANRARALTWTSPTRWRQYVGRKVRERRARRAAARTATQDPVLVRRGKVERATIAALRRYSPEPFPGRLRLFWPSQHWLPSASPLWRAVAEDCEEYFGPNGCAGDTMLLEPHVREFAELFREACPKEGDVVTSLPLPSAPVHTA